MSNSQLFKQAHRMTKLTKLPNETYRYKFGQWLIFLKTAMTNQLGITNINQSVCYVPILEHDVVNNQYLCIDKCSSIKNYYFALSLLSLLSIITVIMFNTNFMQ